MDFASAWRRQGAAASWHAAGPRGASACRREARQWRMADPPVEPRVRRAADARLKTQHSTRLVTLKRRSEFLRVRTGARWATPAFVLEGKRRDSPALPEV